MLRLLGVGGATVAVAATGVAGYRVFDNGVLESGWGAPYDAWSRWRDDPSPLGAIGAAVLAANPHNTQPWVFHVAADGIDVFADPAREMAAVDPARREHHIGLGCAVENLALALAARGYRPAVTWLPDPTDPLLVATVSHVRAPAESSPLHDAIGDRHSNRGPYRAEPVDRIVLEGLAGELPGCVDVRWFTSDADRAALGALIIDATTALIADPDQSEQGLAWFRNDRDDVPTRLTGRRLLQRIHLAATAAGLGLQHMNQVTERIDRERDLGLPATSEPRLRDLLARPGSRALTTFRVGHPVRPALRSPRRPIDAVTR